MTAPLTLSDVKVLAARSGGDQVEVQLSHAVAGLEAGLARLLVDLRLDLLAQVVDDLELLIFDGQEHRPEPGLPHHVEGRRGGAGRRAEVLDDRQLLELDAERTGVDHQRLAGRWSVGSRRPHAAGHDPEGPVASVRAVGHTSLFGDDVQGLEERLVLDVELERRVGRLGAVGLAKVGDNVAGLGLEGLDRLAEPHRVALEGNLRRPEVDLLVLLAERGPDPLDPLYQVRLLLVDARRQEGQNPCAEVDQGLLGRGSGLDLGRLEPLDQLRDPVLEGRFRDLLADGRSIDDHEGAQQGDADQSSPDLESHGDSPGSRKSGHVAILQGFSSPMTSSCSIGRPLRSETRAKIDSSGSVPSSLTCSREVQTSPSPKRTA